MKQWVVYVLKLRDDSLYTGITNDLEQRLKIHEEGKGSKYVFSRLPIKNVVYVEEVKNRSAASKREAEIKKMTRKKKKQLTFNQKLIKEVQEVAYCSARDVRIDKKNRVVSITIEGRDLTFETLEKISKLLKTKIINIVTSGRGACCQQEYCYCGDDSEIEIWCGDVGVFDDFS